MAVGSGVCEEKSIDLHSGFTVQTIDPVTDGLAPDSSVHPGAVSVQPSVPPTVRSEIRMNNGFPCFLDSGQIVTIKV